jgi:hypothetical protein
MKPLTVYFSQPLVTSSLITSDTLTSLNVFQAKGNFVQFKKRYMTCYQNTLVVLNLLPS